MNGKGASQTAHMLQGVLLTFEDGALERDYRAEWARESFSADCGLYMLALSLWTIIWHTLYCAGDGRHMWSAANAVMCLCTLLGMRCAAYVLHTTCRCCYQNSGPPVSMLAKLTVSPDVCYCC